MKRKEAFTFRDAQVGRPCSILLVPARIDMVEACRVLKIRSINGKLVILLDVSKRVQKLTTTHTVSSMAL